ncbi:MAG: uracil-DNA glycosylase [Verrucomicrobia bacterium]|nr:uracil-DNA glycosylase [Verrucomicrobiota bacterium]MBU4247053.1 uracil-DNA glycosylase [Verrucomicrobiota bacterium]MBU4291127.1 uracil-DNA glycosylase [Verrucomicrobiota bacterium]MBU4429297.1 uracil-DNA glycosylase [Verrucomicrobiota bacterium]MBU4498164.1 uracil-DNA glycosylase [Verrucomicrobiota bacterium]
MLMTSSPSDAQSPAGPVVPETRIPVAANDSAVNVKAALAGIASQIAVCTKCVLHKTRTKTVPGQGHSQPEILFVGEGPGADEDLQGLAFVGRAGQLLTRLIIRMGYRREDVFIANVVKCRPPDNRKPLPDEMEACLPFLKAQVAALKPKVIVTLGATALEGLIPAQGKIFITRLRGKWLTYENIPLMPTFHPSYLLRNPPAMWDVWNDMLEVLKLLGRTPPPKKSG